MTKCSCCSSNWTPVGKLPVTKAISSSTADETINKPALVAISTPASPAQMMIMPAITQQDRVAAVQHLQFNSASTLNPACHHSLITTLLLIYSCVIFLF